MRSETACQKELEELRRDLKEWRAKLEKAQGTAADVVRRHFLGNTICAVEGRIEALEWVLKEVKGE